MLTSPMSVRVRWCGLPQHLLVTGYIVHYHHAGGGGDGSVMAPANSTSVEISGLNITETYLFSVEASTNYLPDIIVLGSEQRSLQLS